MNQPDEKIQKFLKTIPENVSVVAVSKTKPATDIMQVYNTGHKVFGENKVQELVEKHDELPKDIEWHMIGHLQSNKVKYIAPFVTLIHSVDSLKLLKIINKEAKKNSRKIDCLFQMHIASEDTKFGFSKDELSDILDSGILPDLENIRVRGLMGMATFTDDQTKIRSEFQVIADFFTELKNGVFSDISYFNELSIGMSNDYQIAIDEGATIIRIGSLIFGERNY